MEELGAPDPEHSELPTEILSIKIGADDSRGLEIIKSNKSQLAPLVKVSPSRVHVKSTVV